MMDNEAVLSWELFDLPQLIAESSWYVHVPLARRIIRIFRPRVVVELGVYYGCSFGVICEAAQRNALDTAVYGVDTWIGDPHAGFYADAVYDNINKYCLEHYPKAQLLRMDFSKALDLFADKSIELLHIDGYHTYEAVKNEYEAWLPKMAEDGIVLFHDISVRDRNFGVYRLWDELAVSERAIAQELFPGLGVLFMGKCAGARKSELFRESSVAGLGLYSKAGVAMAAQISMKMHIEKKARKIKAIEGKIGYDWYSRIESIIASIAKHEN